MFDKPLVRDFMTTKIRSLTPDMPVMQAIDLLLKYEISGAPVLEGGVLVGVISEKDCLMLLTQGEAGTQPQTKVRDVMSKNVATLPVHVDVYYAAGKFLANAFRRFPVVDADGKCVGVISRRDVLKAIQKMRKKPATGRLTRPV